MKIEQPTFEILAYTSNITKLIERAGRVCWKSEDKITDDSDLKFIEMLKGVNHTSVLEHGIITVIFSCDRGVTHELVRHRIASFSQSSTRYCNYSKAKFGSEITVIEPFFFKTLTIKNNDDTSEVVAAHYEREQLYKEWKAACETAESAYLRLLDLGAKAQEARSVLPNSLKTEIVVTANVREWRKIFELRTSNAAHPQIRQIMVPLAWEFAKKWPVLFDEWKDVKHDCPAIEILNNDLMDID